MSKRGSNSELFAHENDALTARPQFHLIIVKSSRAEHIVICLISIIKVTNLYMFIVG